MGIANKECGSKTYHKLGCLQCQGHRPCLSREHHVYPPSSLSVLLSILFFFIYTYYFVKLKYLVASSLGPLLIMAHRNMHSYYRDINFSCAGG